MKRSVINCSSMASYCVEKFGLERIVNLNDDDVESLAQQFVDFSTV